MNAKHFSDQSLYSFLRFLIIDLTNEISVDLVSDVISDYIECNG